MTWKMPLGLFPLVTALSLPACRVTSSAPPFSTDPAYTAPSSYLSLPPSFDDRLLYYNGFENPDGAPEINSAGVTQVGKLVPSPSGVRGKGAITDKTAALVLRSPEFSPHRPLTVSFWWALQEDAKIDTGFNLIHLQGRGIISHFSRGKGEWCALQRNVAILQVYYFPGIQNINGIYDGDFAAHCELKAGIWHHSALVIQGASLIQVYTDGRLAWTARIDGRPLSEDDKVGEITLGTRGAPGLTIDEVLILRRALTPDEIQTYYTAIRQMREVGYPR